MRGEVLARRRAAGKGSRPGQGALSMLAPRDRLEARGGRLRPHVHAPAISHGPSGCQSELDPLFPLAVPDFTLARLAAPRSATTLTIPTSFVAHQFAYPLP